MPAAIPFTYKGVTYRSVRAAAAANGVHPNTLYYTFNSAHILQKNREWHRNNPEKSRAIRRRMAGLPTPEYPAPAVCEICHRAPGKRVLNLDHDHKTGDFRGWLCSNCNTGLGLFRDNVALLAAAISYLETSLE